MLGFAAWLVVAAGPDQAAPARHPTQPPTASAPPSKEQAAPPTVSEVVVTAPKAAPEADWVNKLNFDVHGKYGGSDTPYLRQRPVNGCKLMAGGATSQMGPMGAAGGMVCSKSF